MGDIHIGSKFLDEDLLKRRIEQCLENKYPVFLMGDQIEAATRDSVGAGVYEQSEIIDSQVEHFYHLFNPLAKEGLILGMHDGNHECVSEDTDILTEEGWVNVKEVQKEKIAQFDKKGRISFTHPLKKIRYQADKIVEFIGRNTKQKVTLNHELILNNKKIKAEKLLSGFPQNITRLSGTGSQKGIALSESDIRILTWVIMDGTLIDERKYNPKSIKRRIQFKLSKNRKIERLSSLLDCAQIPYTLKEAKKSKHNKLQPYYIRIYGDEARRIFSLLKGVKEIPSEWMFFNKKQIKCFLEELQVTDGYPHYQAIIWRTTDKRNADIIQASCILNDYPCYIRDEGEGNSGFKEKSKRQFRVTISLSKQENLLNSKVIAEVHPYNGEVYCFTMPKGTLITRVGGKVAFTGNSRVYKATGFDIAKAMARQLGVPYWEYSKLHNIKVGTESYTMYTTHGASGARMPHTKIKGALDLANVADVEIYAMGHVHTLDHHVRTFYEVDKRNKKVVEKQKHFIITGSYLRHWGSYAHIKAMEPTPLGSPTLKLGGETHEVRVTL